MATREQILNKIRSLPDDLLVEVGDFAEFLHKKRGKKRFTKGFIEETWNLMEGDMADYLAGLESYEEKLAKGEILWK